MIQQKLPLRTGVGIIVLNKQNKIDLSLAQYNKALEKYNDETSKSIISMKIANLGKKVDK